MHLTGEWKRGRGEAHDEKTCAPSVSLSYSDDIHVVTDERRSICFMGEVLASEKDILKCPSDRLHELSGMYLYVAKDHDTGVTFIGTDAIGFAPLYYSLTRDRLLFGSNVSLLKYRVKPRTPDIETWDEILNFGDIIGDKTVLKEIKRLLAGVRIRIADDRVHFETVWMPEYPDFVDRDKYVARNNELLLESLVPCIRKR